MKKLWLIPLLLFLFMIQINAYNKAVVDITKMDIYEIQEAVDDGYLTYELLTRLYLDRIAAYNKQYNALISINEEAVALAKAKDVEYKQTGRSSLLFGIPIILKDNIDFKSLPTTAGTKALMDSYPNNNAVVVENLIKAGVVVLGKSNMSEFAFSAATSRSSYGSVKNAYDLNYTPYGSSGGSAVAVASSLAAIALGTDTNSSIRLPSSANNVVGLRPTYNLLSLEGIIAYDKERDVVGPMTKSVTDNAILMTILAKNNIDYTKSLKQDGLEGKKIGVLTEFMEQEASSLRVLSYYHEPTNLMMKQAIAKMEQAGASIVYIDQFYSSHYQSLNYNSLMGSLMCYDFNQYIKNTSSAIKSYEQLLNKGGYIQNLASYNISCNYDQRLTNGYKTVNKLKDEYRSYINEVMNKNDVDVLVYPSTKNKTLKLSDVDSKLYANVTSTIAPTTGYPALNMPLGFDEGLPYGLEFLSLPNQEQLLYEVGYGFEMVNNNRENPKIAPSLYVINDDVLSLKNKYENSHMYKFLYEPKTYKTYNEIRNQVKLFLTSYNDYSDDEISAKASALLTEYDNSITDLQETYLLEDKTLYFYLGITYAMIVFIIISKIKVYNLKRR